MRKPLLGLSLIAVAVALASCNGNGGASSTAPETAPPPTAPPEPTVFHCSLTTECPEVLVDGDPFATLGGDPSPFRGYGDPSLEAGDDGTLWLSYSFLELVIADAGPPLLADLGVRTHLARSDDGGASFRFERALNTLELSRHPDTGTAGWTEHEVSTLVRRPDGTWQVAWLDYFDQAGGAVDRSDIRLSSSTARSPQDLGDRVETLLAAVPTSASFPPRYRLPDGACPAFTEPALLAHDGETYLALHCVSAAATQRVPAAESLTLLLDTGDGYEIVGDLLTGADAAALGFDVLTQPDLTMARDGTLLLIVTPKNLGEDPAHRGCLVFTVDDLHAASVVRDAGGVPLPRAVITADGNGLGPGLCTYDAASDTGLLLVITSFQTSSDPVDIVFSLRKTGVHP